MKALVIALVIAPVLGALAAPASAAEESPCVATAGPMQADFPLRQVAAAIDSKHLAVTVVGTASSTLPGENGAAKAYPARLGEALRARFPGVDVQVTAHTKARDNAATMAKDMQQILAADKPALVIWQAGTVDAMLGVDPDDFQSALDDGLDVLRGKVDAVLVNMQYSPRTDAMIALGAYLDAMRYAAMQHETLLFDRLNVMKNWNDAGIFNLHADTKTIDVAEHVHDCIGRLLAGLIVDGVEVAKANNATNNTGAASPDNKDNKETH
ncbi:MAG TPA: SGNH/GDSL hydrolase family protein [Xanthobacteraceae bacterium]|nr:SGNH/GDSL hydrolase family protein [Xanthobacteraceae bacterium]